MLSAPLSEASQWWGVQLMVPQQEPSPLRLAGIGLELAGVIGVMVALGYAVDQWLGSGPWGIVVGGSLGIIGGLYNLIKQVMKMSQ
jgi:F0F1-type ATP synthase assembly protein I